MDVFRGRVRQRSTPRNRLRLSSSSPVLNRTYNRYFPPNTKARFRADDREFTPKERGRNVVRNSQMFDHRNGRNIWEFRNTARGPRPGPSQRFTDAYHEEDFRLVRSPNRFPSNYVPHETVAGPNRPPIRIKGRRRKNNNRKRREAKPQNRTPLFVEHDEHAEREFFEDYVEEDYSPPRRQNHFVRQHSGPQTQFQRRSSMYDFPSRSFYRQQDKRVSFVNHEKNFRDTDVSVDRQITSQKRKRDRISRYFPRENDRAEERPQRFTHNNEYIPAQPALKNTIKSFYDIIRLVHHLSKVTTKVTDNQPITFQRLTRLLTNTVRPAFPGEQVRTMLEGNAKNWSFTTQLILEKHYETLIDEALQNVRTQNNHHDWPKAFEIAAGWANRNFHSRITPESIEQAEALITAEMPHSSVTLRTENACAPTYAEVVTRGGHASATGVATTAQAAYTTVSLPQVTHVPVTTATQVASTTVTSPPVITTDSLIRAKTTSRTVEIQTSPGLLVRGDWPLDEEVPTVGLQETLQPIQAVEPLLTQEVDNTREMESQPIQAPELPPLGQRATKKTRKEKHCRDTLPPLEEPTRVPAPAGVDRQMSFVGPQRLEEPVVALLAPDGEEDSYPCPFQKAGSTHSSDLLFSDHSDQHPEPSALLHEFLNEAAQQIGESEHRETASENSSPELPRIAPIFTSMRKAPPPTTPQTLRVTTKVPMLPLTPGSLPNRHINTKRKLTDWNLKISKKFVIIGDSNLARFPASNCPDLQVESYPGAKIHHAGTLIEKATLETVPEKMIVAFGLNNRQQRYRMSATTELQKAHSIIKKRMPGTEILFPLINFSRTLPHGEQGILEHLNTHIKNHLNSIPALPSALFHVEGDGVHWKPATARAILELWMTALNCRPAQAQ